MKRIIVLLASLAAIFAFAVPSAANASQTDFTTHWTLTFGAYCLWSNGTTQGAIETVDICNGHNWTMVFTGGGYNDPSGECQQQGGNCAIYKFYAGNDGSTKECEAPINNTGLSKITLVPCNGSNGVDWAFLCNNFPTCTHWEWINVYTSNNFSSDWVLTSDNTAADRTYNDCQGCHPGEFQQWSEL